MSDNGSSGDKSEHTPPSPDVPKGIQPQPSQFKGVLKPFGYIDQGIAFFEIVILSAGVLLMATNSIANIFGRFVLGQSIYFSEEVNQFLVILITFAGIGYAARRGRHIRMSAFYDQLGDKPRKLLMIGIALVTSAVMFVLAWYAALYVLSVYNTGRIASATRIPLFWTMIWVPVGFTVTGIQYFLTALANMSRPDVYLSSTVVDSYEDSETPL